MFATVTGSSLIFDDADITLEAHDIRVEGALSMGSDTCRLYSNIRVILHGSRNTASVLESDQVSKAITVVGATASIDMCVPATSGCHRSRSHHSHPRVPLFGFHSSMRSTVSCASEESPQCQLTLWLATCSVHEFVC